MPTGYTSIIEEGEVKFENFVMRCARAMMSLISLRDLPLDAPIPKEIKPNEYYEKQIFDANSELQTIVAMSDIQIQKMIDDEYEERTKVYQEHLEKQKMLTIRYDDMLRRVESWEPPTNDHEDLKKFMIQQINDSKPSEKYGMSKPTKLSVKEWRSNKRESLIEDIKYYGDKYKKEVTNCEWSTRWIQDLRDSLNIT